MKKILLLSLLLFIFSSISAQKTNLIFFTEDGDKFYVILNSVLQNSTAETNVKVTDLPAPTYKLKILFEDSTMEAIEKNLMFNQGTETTFNIKKNNKDEWVVRYFNEVPIAQAPAPLPTQSVVVFSASGPSMPVVPVATTTVSTSQTTTTTTAGVSTPAGGVTVGISVDPDQGGTGVVVSAGTTGTGISTTTTTTTMTTTTSTGVNTQPVHVTPQPSNPLPGYTGAVGCPYPMSPSDFDAMKASIAAKSFDDSKLTLAKQVIASNCLLSSQVREIMLLFSFEDNRLELAKYAYGYTYDLGNYYKVNDAFTFESTIEELNEYITGIGK